MTRTAWIAVGSVTALAVALAVALAIAVASAGEDEPDAPDAPGVVAPGIAPSAEFRDCMSERGVEPEPGVPMQEPPPGFEEALEACHELLPDGGEGGLRIMPPG